MNWIRREYHLDFICINTMNYNLGDKLSVSNKIIHVNKKKNNGKIELVSLKK